MLLRHQMWSDLSDKRKITHLAYSSVLTWKFLKMRTVPKKWILKAANVLAPLHFQIYCLTFPQKKNAASPLDALSTGILCKALPLFAHPRDSVHHLPATKLTLREMTTQNGQNSRKAGLSSSAWKMPRWLGQSKTMQMFISFMERWNGLWFASQDIPRMIFETLKQNKTKRFFLAMQPKVEIHSRAK